MFIVSNDSSCNLLETPVGKYIVAFQHPFYSFITVYIIWHIYIYMNVYNIY